MKSNRFGYYIREGVGSIFAHGFMSFASVVIITACLIIMGCFVLLSVNVNEIIGDLEKENIILAYVDEAYSEAEARALEKRITAIPNVTYVTFTTREEAFENFIGKYEDRQKFQNLDASVFRHRFYVYIDDIAQTENTAIALRDIREIAKVNVNLEIARGFVKVRNIVSIISVVIVAILLIISLFIMQNTIKLTTFERRDEIGIMKMVGATNSFIRWPFVFEGFLLGVFGALLAFFALWVLYMMIAGNLISTDAGFITVIPFGRVALPMFVAFAAIGFGVGVGGSVIAIRRYLKV